MNEVTPSTIVGIDPTARGLAFVVFHNGRVFDWGTRGGRGQEIRVTKNLVDLYQPDVLVVEDPDAKFCELRPRSKKMIRSIAAAMRRKGVKLILVSRHSVRLSWRARGVKRKEAVAGQIAKLFPAIEYLVPRPRKVYETEVRRIHIFDAISLVLNAFPLGSDGAGEGAGEGAPSLSAAAA